MKWIWRRFGFSFVSNYIYSHKWHFSIGVWIKWNWCTSLVCTRGCAVCVCAFLPVCTEHQPPVPCLDNLGLVPHGSHWAADSCRSPSQTGVGNEAAAACSPAPLPPVSLLVDCSAPSPASACRLHHLSDVKAARVLVAKPGSPAGSFWNLLDSVAGSGSRGRFPVVRRCCDG